jgi:hypothetical protein
MLEQPIPSVSKTWLGLGNKTLLSIVAAIAALAAFAVDIGGIRTGLLNLMGSEDRSMSLTNVRYMTNPSRVSMVINKQYDVVVSNCFIRTEDAAVSVQVSPPRRSLQHPYSLMVDATPARKMTLRVQCDGTASDWVTVRVG